MMQSSAATVNDYLSSLPEDRKAAVTALRSIIKKNLPKGFKETMDGMINYVVPLSLYPAGYHCTPGAPLPFLSIASQKNFIAVYHMGIYADKKLLDWFVKEFPKHSDRKLDMGKSCLRFSKPEHIPVKLIGELVKRMSAQQWIDIYEKNFKR